MQTFFDLNYKKFEIRESQGISHACHLQFFVWFFFLACLLSFNVHREHPEHWKQEAFMHI